MIDCTEDAIEAATQFWSQALGMPEMGSRGPDNPYVILRGRLDSVAVGTQRIGSASRLHFDIETDDVEAEAERLENLGARRVEYLDSLWIMEDPAGMPFCVVSPHRDDSLENANVWNG
jgi:hypothetical protein|tara:strand:+ start:2535 stop:2888 length:354 start_codon:yes stop_codon:yes gene_type:complete